MQGYAKRINYKIFGPSHGNEYQNSPTGWFLRIVVPEP